MRCTFKRNFCTFLCIIQNGASVCLERSLARVRSTFSHTMRCSLCFSKRSPLSSLHFLPSMQRDFSKREGKVSHRKRDPQATLSHTRTLIGHVATVLLSPAPSSSLPLFLLSFYFFFHPCLIWLLFYPTESGAHTAPSIGRTNFTSRRRASFFCIYLGFCRRKKGNNRALILFLNLSSEGTKTKHNFSFFDRKKPTPQHRTAV